MDKNVQEHFLCNFDEQNFKFDNEYVTKLWIGDWYSSNTNMLNDILASNLESEPLLQYLQSLITNESNYHKLLHLAIGIYLKFCDQNWSVNKDPLREEISLDMLIKANSVNELQQDSVEIYTNIKNPGLLWFSIQIFKGLVALEENWLHLWWLFRCKVTHQRILEDTSATIYSDLELLIAKLYNEANNLKKNPRLKCLLYTEISQAYLMYGRVQKVDEYLTKARNILGLKLELTGILGKRTKFQQNSLPQLALLCNLDDFKERPSAEQSHGSSQLPPLVDLQDDVRLNKIHYNDSICRVELPSLEQTLCLLTVQYLQKAQPKDELMNEELQPYLDLVLCHPKGAWSTRVAALLLRCKLEANNKRTVERAMTQCEAIVNHTSNESAVNRLSYVWASGLQPSWCWRQLLADLYLSLGLVKAALEEYLRLQLWEDVIVCYTVLQLRHKAAEVIQQQIDIKPTVKLYCLLGDATDKIEYYEKAWEFSSCKSSRAQRHWGNYLFNHKHYEECIPHFEKSLEINSLQENVWLRLGYAALMTEQWETSAKAYRRYTYLQPNTFEAWNNLAKVYVKQADKPRAYRALMEALKFNYDNWKLWENVIAVSMDTGHFEDVIRGCHRILDLRNKLDDLEVLTLLVRAVMQDRTDADGHSAARLQKRVLELFGRITSVQQNQPELWQLYADLSPSDLLRSQRLLKAYRGFAQNGSWSSNPDTCKTVIELAISLLHYSIKAKQESDDKDRAQCEQQVSSARLTGQAVIRAAEKQRWPPCEDSLEELNDIFSKLTTANVATYK